MKRSLMTYVLGCALSFLICVAAWAETETYVIDPVHSSVTFKIRHFFSKVSGAFTQFEGMIEVDREKMEEGIVKASIDTASINTHHSKRDDHLRGSDFFDAEKFSKMTFQSKQWKEVAPDEFEVTGDLSMHGVTKEVVLRVKSLGFGEGIEEAYLSGWSASATIRKSDFGIIYGGKALGDDVEIAIEVEAKRQ